MTYGAMKTSNSVILWLRKEKSTAPFQTASDPPAANKVLFFKVVMNNPYGELYDKNEYLELIGFTDFE